MEKGNTKIKYFIYARKSTDTEDKQLASIDAQIEELTKIAKRENLQVVEVLSESQSAKKPGRPIFNAMVERIHSGEASGIICWKVDRLARNPVDGGLISWMLQLSTIKHIRCFDKQFYPTDNVIMMSLEFGVANQQIRDLSVNVKRGLRARVGEGWRPNKAPSGYLNTPYLETGCKTITEDPERFLIIRKAWDLMLTGNYTIPKILKIINKEFGYLTLKSSRQGGNPMALSSLYRLFTNTFYYGYFEYPLGSGNWVKGSHKPMVSEDEFQRVQAILGKRGKPAPKEHNFAFTGLMKCGCCGSSITAEIKVKRPKNGKVHNYVYYHCTKKKNPNCLEKSIEIKDLHKQIDIILEKITISDDFKEWAIKNLHEVRKRDAITHQVALHNKQKEFKSVTEQLSSLLLKYTSSSNSGGQLISDDEYKILKTTLTKKKEILENELNNQSKQFSEWIELSEKTFNFARYARIWFNKGDKDIQRSIVACLGSNLIVKDKKLNINLHPMFKTLVENNSNVGSTIEHARTTNNLDNKKINSVSKEIIPTWLPDLGSNQD